MGRGSGGAGRSGSGAKKKSGGEEASKMKPAPPPSVNPDAAKSGKPENPVEAFHGAAKRRTRVPA